MKSVEILERLIGFNTISDRSNIELIDFVENYLDDLGVPSFRVTGEQQGKANLVATIGPHTTRAGIILSGHSDVVPVEGQPWSTDPFTLSRVDDRLYGRGSCDMKGFIAICLAAVPELQRLPLNRPLHIVITYDEETDLTGAIDLMPALRERNFDPEAVIIGEPTGMKMITAHKGHFHVETTVTGQDAHASLPQLGLNAIVLSAALVNKLEGMADRLKKNGARLSGLEPGHTTINVGTIRGGAQFNIVPRKSVLEWEMRIVPGDDGDDLVSEFQQYSEQLILPHRSRVPEAAISSRPVLRVAPMVPRESCRARRLIGKLTGDDSASAVPFGTEAPCYQSLGMPVVVYGPGSIEQAHKPDEFISMGQIAQCERFVMEVGRYLCE